MKTTQLKVQAGFASCRGRREENQDFGAFTEPAADDLLLHGMVAAIADGMGGAKGGRVAAEVCVRGFLDAYYGLPPTLSVKHRAAYGLHAINNWIYSTGRRDASLAGMATTFTALILRNRQAFVLHAGDTRVYRLRGETLEQLTEDHTFKNQGMDHILRRAVGLENTLCADSAAFSLEAHDRFLLCSDGLHAVLSEHQIRRFLQERAAPQQTAEVLTQQALAVGSQDNISALVVDVIMLPPPDFALLRAGITSLPIGEIPSIGTNIDGFYLEKILSAGRYSCLFLARDSGGSAVVLKFPQPRVAEEREYHAAFLREAWIAARIHSPWVVEVNELAPGYQSRLYSVSPFYPGRTLEQRIKRGGCMELKEGVDIALKLCKAVHALHRQQIIHRDIKPENILLLDGGGLKLVDLGVARLPAWDGDLEIQIPGTPSYMAPEQFGGERGTQASDVFALGATLYRMFAKGAYPYGEIEPFSTPRFRSQPKALAGYRPDLPGWLDTVLAKALAVNPKERYYDAIELAFDLENGLARGGQIKRPQQPFYERNPLLFWKLVSLMLLIALLLSLSRHGV
jgi:serine/threonine protein phosphatase PrpC